MTLTSISVPCPKTVSLVSGVGSNLGSSNQRNLVSFPSSVSNPNQKSLSFGSSLPGFLLFFSQCPNKEQSSVLKAKAKMNEVAAEESSNSAPKVGGNDKPAEPNIPDAASIMAFMTQVSDLVKLVDSRDIIELQLAQADCELVIRKKEALQPPTSVAPVFAQPSYPQAVMATPPPAPVAAPAPAPAPALPPPAKTSTSSHPPLKSPMAGTFYRSPAPGESPFVKLGDKVQKGQVVCIVEAMKLMNEIEADQSGTITGILLEDGKPVSVDTPLFVIVP